MDNKYDNKEGIIKSNIDIVRLDYNNQELYTVFFENIAKEATQYTEHPQSINNIPNKQFDHFNDQIKKMILNK